MSRIYFTFFLLFSLQVGAQVLPREGSALNYRLVGFSFPEIPDINEYKLEVAQGYCNNPDSFQRKIVFFKDINSNKVVEEMPAFGKQYTWRVIYGKKKKPVKSSAFYHFSTNMNPRVDSTNLRLRILHHSDKYKDMYVALDGGGMLYDMNGSPIWFIPDSNGLGGYVVDMQFTTEGTITFLYGRQACEINLNGDILWSAPTHDTVSGDTSFEKFHHEFRKLSNGHYMVLGMQLPFCKQVTVHDSNYISVYKGAVTGDNIRQMVQDGYKRARFGTIIEYDQKGNVVWSWRTSKYLLASPDFAYFMPEDSNLKFDPHDNTFFFDEQAKAIYLGFKNMNQVIRIDYPGGKVSRTYGTVPTTGHQQGSDGLFCNSHNIGRTQEGYLCYFNNNSCHNIPALPTVVMLREPESGNGIPEKIWEYRCDMDGQDPIVFNSGGSVIELPDRSVFVNMGSEYSKLFIVNRNKDILWSALPERYIETDNKWVSNRQYRVNIINRINIERMVWNAETFNKNR